jgi:hypothetical protein
VVTAADAETDAAVDGIAELAGAGLDDPTALADVSADDEVDAL